MNRPRATRAFAGCAALVAVLIAGCAGSPTRTAPSPAAYDESLAARSGPLADLDPCPAPDRAGMNQPVGTSDRPTALPDVALPCLGPGPHVRLPTLRGPAVINVWASWCPPCRDELPHLQMLHARAGDRVQVLGVDFKDPVAADAHSVLREAGVRFPSVVDPEGALAAPLRLAALPQTFFVNARGRIVHRLAGPVRSAADLLSLVEKYLGVRPSGGR